MEILREHAPWGWRARISVVGREHIDEALAAGRGAVLWYCPFAHADVVFKRGLHEAGYRVNHLSAATHGFSDTRFGRAVLNPIKTRVERRYLKERCVMGDSGVGEVIRGLLARLRQNELVSVTALQTGRRTGARPLFGGTLRLAKGAPNFALCAGAALIPIFVVPIPGGYEVRIEPPLPSSGDGLEAQEEACISAYVPVLERYVVRYPSLWRGWLGSPSYWRPEPTAAPR
jgi:lauroyl/myristoyl acyltransferase